MSPGTGAALLPLSLTLVVSTREPWAPDQPSGGGKDTAAFAPSPERWPQRAAPAGGSAQLTEAGAWPPPQDWGVYA